MDLLTGRTLHVVFMRLGAGLITLALSGASSAQPVAARTMAPMADQAASRTQVAHEAVSAGLGAACPRQVRALLVSAMPGATPSADTIEAICECTQAADQQAAPTSPTAHAARPTPAMLACSKPTITAHNQQWTIQEFGAYLAKRGWKDQDILVFSQCVAEGQWTGAVDAERQGRGSAVKRKPLFDTCAARAGRPDTVLPVATAARRLPASATQR